MKRTMTTVETFRWDARKKDWAHDTKTVTTMDVEETPPTLVPYPVVPYPAIPARVPYLPYWTVAGSPAEIIVTSAISSSSNVTDTVARVNEQRAKLDAVQGAA